MFAFFILVAVCMYHFYFERIILCEKFLIIEKRKLNNFNQFGAKFLNPLAR